ncbi:MAG: sigma-70 family RNA polymerase sigma factor [Actinomycetota bacterium]
MGGRPGLLRQTDATLLRACRQGDQRAWNAIVRRYGRLVQGVALQLGLSRHEAEDVTQSTFTTLVESMSSIREGDRLSSWLVTVARRETFRVRHHPERQAPSDRVDLTDETVEHDLTDAIWLHDAIQNLSEPSRTLLMRLFFDPQRPSYAELAEDLGKAVGSIGPLRANSLRELRRELERGGAR